MNSTNETIMRAVSAMEDALGDLTPAQREELERDTRISMQEHDALQRAQSVAFAEGRLPLEVASFLYNALGEFPSKTGWSARTSLAERIVAIKLFEALAEREGQRHGF